MIRYEKHTQTFYIETKNTTYAMRVVHDRYLVHLYYGKKTDNVDVYYKEYPVSFAPYPLVPGVEFSLDTVSTELSFFDSGDKRDTGIKIRNANGDAVTAFYYKDYRIFNGRKAIVDMPYSRNGEQTLEITYFDEVSHCVLRSYYTVYYESDTIVRYVEIENVGTETVIVESLLACQLDCVEGTYNRTYLCGNYANERNIVTAPLFYGKQGIYSERGHSSHQFNPFLILKKDGANEREGEAYAFEFVYSGDFEIQTEKMYDGRIRTLVGLNRNTFSWCLKKGGTFSSPETILSFSNQGTTKLSQNLHNHIRNNIIPSKFVYKERPIVMNTWEASYFDIDEDVLYQYALAAKDLGIDTIVIDDGWFGKRNNDKAGLGDWHVNRNKFKEGLVAFSEKIHRLGMKLGIWIEPEMINPDSDLYRLHPEWVLKCKDREPSLGRNQLVLDLCNDDVIEYIVSTLKETLFPVKPDYIKWDFNRTLSEVGSPALSNEQQREVKHRFVLGSYRLHKLLTEAFPETLFEGCSGGGGRFDAGILYYCPQIWTSDNTDPVDRISIQKGTMLAYPLSSISCHISDTLNNGLESAPDYGFRFNIAAAGILGYEMNILKLKESDKIEIKREIEAYREIEELILSGDIYRIDEGLEECETAFYVANKEKDRCCIFYYNTGSLKECALHIDEMIEGEYINVQNGEVFDLKSEFKIVKQRSVMFLLKKIKKK